ncbi:MAG: hypothetical protein MJZ65_00855 [Paludibacteraceae bacterium]|nr:hypothetical protein [Paludibacteraceae bacterium]
MKTININNMLQNHTSVCVLIGLLLCVSVGLSAQTDGAVAPSAGFGSTSSMVGSGSAYSSTPTINSYGYANQSDYVANRGRMGLPGDGSGTTDKEDGNEPGLNDPIGDAVPFLLLLAAGYAFLARRKKA